MASLPELQRDFAAALRDASRDCAIAPATNLAIYRNNSRAVFRAALEASFPVLRRRVGDDYFRQLAALYREQQPSRCGDLFWVGRGFADFLDAYLADGEYLWLADLARVEWCCQEALVAAYAQPVPVEALATYAPEALASLVFSLQPSLRLAASNYPVFTVWSSNREPNAPPVDQSRGSEQGLIYCGHEGLQVKELEARKFKCVQALAGGEDLSSALGNSSLDADGLRETLRLLFAAGLVTQVGMGGGLRTSS